MTYTFTIKRASGRPVGLKDPDVYDNLSSEWVRLHGYRDNVKFKEHLNNLYGPTEIIKDFSSLEELITFIKEYEDIIMRENSITIYDDYVE